MISLDMGYCWESLPHLHCSVLMSNTSEEDGPQRLHNMPGANGKLQVPEHLCSQWGRALTARELIAAPHAMPVALSAPEVRPHVSLWQAASGPLRDCSSLTYICRLVDMPVLADYLVLMRDSNLLMTPAAVSF